MKHITGLACTNGRFTYLERLLTCFLRQDHENKSLLIYNNASIPISMDPIEGVTLINNYIDYTTNRPYDNLGSIYRDALTHVHPGTEYISIMDDDDIYLPDHYSRGVQSLVDTPGFSVWKPGYYFRKKGLYDVLLIKSDNNLEGSCIIKSSFLKEFGFQTGTSLTLHFPWLLNAKKRNKILLDERILNPTYCYETDQQDIIHTSAFSLKFPNLNKTEIDSLLKKIGNYGQGKILERWSDERIENYFKLYFDASNFEDV